MSAMYWKLPLFPLNTVLFPGMALPLRVFEPRYLRMVRDCLEGEYVSGDPVFGVVLIEEGKEVAGPVKPYEIGPIQNIGTTARILALEHQTEDVLHITTVGEERFIIHDVSRDRPYLVADVEPFPLDQGEGAKVAPLFDLESMLLTAYLDLLSEAHGVEIQLQQAPESAETMAYLVAALLQVGLSTKQELLSIADLPTLLQREMNLLRNDISALTVMLRGEDILDREDVSPLSSN
jgi:Lon protease-like protein